MPESISSRDSKKNFKANALQQNIEGLSTTGFNTTVRNIGSGGPKSFIGYVLNNNDSADRWFLVFYRPASEIILGTTAPDFTTRVGASATVAWDFLDPVREGTGLSAACTTTENGSTGPTSAMTGTVFYSD